MSASALALPLPAVAATQSRKKMIAAMLLPLSGANADLGRSMARAAALAQPATARPGELLVLDTQGTAEGAAAAAAIALRRGAMIVLGPVFAREVRPVLSVTGDRAQVITFSNDPDLRESGAFTLGITPAQLTDPVLGYARERGVAHVGLVADDDGWGRHAAAAADAACKGLGVSLTQLGKPGQDPAALVSLIRQLPDAQSPDAVLLAGGGDGNRALASSLHGAGIQVLATLEGVDYAPEALTALEGAWISAPDPAGFETFAQRYEEAHGTLPGPLVALAYDGVGIAMALHSRGGFDRSAITSAAGFPGVDGAIRFRSDGSGARTLPIMTVQEGAYRVISGGAPA